MNTGGNGTNSGSVNVYKYSTPGSLGGVWEQLGSTINGENANDYLLSFIMFFVVGERLIEFGSPQAPKKRHTQNIYIYIYILFF